MQPLKLSSSSSFESSIATDSVWTCPSIGPILTDFNTRLLANYHCLQVTVLNEGAVIIRRPGRADTSDEEESEEEKEEESQQVEEQEPEEPPRDPLDVEEEMLNEKLQTAGFFLSMPEEEQIKKRLLEIKQMKENPELFTPENTKVGDSITFLWVEI